jgi:hypothetical protein
VRGAGSPSAISPRLRAAQPPHQAPRPEPPRPVSATLQYPPPWRGVRKGVSPARCGLRAGPALRRLPRRVPHRKSRDGPPCRPPPVPREGTQIAPRSTVRPRDLGRRQHAFAIGGLHRRAATQEISRSVQQVMSGAQRAAKDIAVVCEAAVMANRSASQTEESSSDAAKRTADLRDTIEGFLTKVAAA